jgi:uncharacterized protein
MKNSLLFSVKIGNLSSKTTMERYLDVTDKKYQDLQDILRNMGSVLVAFSGGVDSAFLLKTAKDVLTDGVLAVTAASEIQLFHELEEARTLAADIGAEHIVVQTREMEDETFVSNPCDRCYHCKKMIFGTLRRIAEERNIPVILDGSNTDDTGDVRPGMKALEELGVRSPLKEAGLTKDEIRELSKTMGLPTWNKPALACLASRIPYGDRITPEKLRRIDKAETFLREQGIRQVRVRDHGSVARIEISPEDKSKFSDERFAEQVSAKLKELGFIYVALDLEGYRTGSLNSSVT